MRRIPLEGEILFARRGPAATVLSCTFHLNEVELHLSNLFVEGRTRISLATESELYPARRLDKHPETPRLAYFNRLERNRFAGRGVLHLGVRRIEFQGRLGLYRHIGDKSRKENRKQHHEYLPYRIMTLILTGGK